MKLAKRIFTLCLACVKRQLKFLAYVSVIPPAPTQAAYLFLHHFANFAYKPR